MARSTLPTYPVNTFRSPTAHSAIAWLASMSPRQAIPLPTRAEGGPYKSHVSECANRATNARMPKRAAVIATSRICPRRRQLSLRKKFLHSEESFFEASHVGVRKHVGNAYFLERRDGELHPGPATHRENRDVSSSHLRQRADDFPGVGLRLHRSRPQVEKRPPLVETEDKGGAHGSRPETQQCHSAR